jgi:hypothetical protein
MSQERFRRLSEPIGEVKASKPKLVWVCRRCRSRDVENRGAQLHPQMEEPETFEGRPPVSCSTWIAESGPPAPKWPRINFAPDGAQGRERPRQLKQLERARRKETK